MSWLLRGITNAVALEVTRIREAMGEIAIRKARANAGALVLRGAPSSIGTVDARNLFIDPQALGVAANDGVLVAATLSRVDASEGGVLPAGWGRYLQIRTDAAAGSYKTAPVKARRSGEGWWYLFVTATAPAVVQVLGPEEAVEASAPVAATDGWVLLGGPLALVAGGTYRLRLEAAAAETVVGATGITIAEADEDPGAPFSGDSAETARYAFRWEGARNDSPSLRHGPSFDLLARMEATSGLDVAPAGLSEEQRAAWLLGRSQARNHPYGQTVIELLTELIQTEDPSFSSEGVRVVQDFVAQTVEVQIAYDPQGALAGRIQRLLSEIIPCHLRLTGVSFSAFQAGISAADEGAI